MKKLFVSLATIIAAVCLCATAAFAADYQTTNAAVNLRYGPSTGYSVICVVPAGAQVYVNQADNGTGWTYVTYGNTVGYIASRYLGNGATSSSNVYYNTSYMTTAAVNLRSGPSVEYSVYTVVPAGTIVYPDGVTNDGWAHVYYGGYSGYVSNGYLTSVYTGNGSSTYSPYSNPTSDGTTWYNGCNYANVYDYNYYRANNQDLVAVFGNDPSALIQHFVNFGMDEGRQGISSFNVYAYMDQHPDLRQRFGSNLRCYYLYACGLM